MKMRTIWLSCPGKNTGFKRIALVFTVLTFTLVLWNRTSTPQTLTVVDQSPNQLSSQPHDKTLPSMKATIVESPYKNKTYISRVGFLEFNQSNCYAAFNATAKNEDFPQKVKLVPVDRILQDARSDCQNFQRIYGFTRYPSPTQEEREFPLAFIVLFHKDINQILYLLRAIYHPHNTYCLSVDLKSGPSFVEDVQTIAKCIPNVFVASKLEHIVYAGFPRLKADLNCMEDLLRSEVKWRYVINMAGQQFPLRTNLELVRILSLFNGTNDVEGLGGGRMLPNRYLFKYDYVKNENTGQTSLVRTSERNPALPHGLEVVKGSAYGSFSRAFVNFVVNSNVSKDFQQWCKTVYSPDEYFWATLHHSKKVDVPGRYTGPLEAKKWLSTFASWGKENTCATWRVRGVCIFSPEDLPLLLRRYEFSANKFYISHHPGALHCLDNLIYNMTVHRTVRDLSFYRTMPFAERDTR